MPREIVHWDILNRAVGRLSKESHPDLWRIAHEHPLCLALGAVAHDAPYYRHGGGSRFEWVGSLLHGIGGGTPLADTLRPLSSFGAAVSMQEDGETRDAGIAFLMGLLSHYAVDVIYHPPIFFFTGDYYAVDERERSNARARHRLFEVYLDEDRSAHGTNFPWPVSIQTMLDEISNSTLRVVDEALAQAVTEGVTMYDPELVRSLPQEWNRSLREMARFQMLFLSPVWGAIAQGLNRISRDRLHQFEVLFARGRRGHHGIFHEPWNYHNPLSGAAATTSLFQLDEQAIDLTLQLFSKVQVALVAGSLTSDTLANGVSLNYGLADGAPEDAAHFSAQGFQLPGLELS